MAMHSASVKSCSPYPKMWEETHRRSKKTRRDGCFHSHQTLEASTVFSHFHLDKLLFSTLKVSLLRCAGHISSREPSISFPLTSNCPPHMQGSSKILDSTVVQIRWALASLLGSAPGEWLLVKLTHLLWPYLTCRLRGRGWMILLAHFGILWVEDRTLWGGERRGEHQTWSTEFTRECK